MVLVVIDGSYGEGSGAVLRTAIAMSALTVQPTRIENVRGATNAQGLNAEDIALIQVLAKSTGAETVGCEVLSSQVSFLPTHMARPFRGDVTPPSQDPEGQMNVLVLCASAAPVLARAGGLSSLKLQGETFGRNVLGYDSFEGTLVRAWNKMGLYIEPELINAGFGLKSRGSVQVDIEPSALFGVKWTDRGELVQARAIVSLGQLPVAIAERAVSHLNRLAQSVGVPLDAEMNLYDSETPGAHVTVLAEFESGFGSGSAAGARGVRIEAVCQQAFSAFQEWHASGSTVDSYLADQLLLAAVLAEGESIFKIHRLTQRFLSMVWVIKQFLPIHITVKGQEGNPGTVTIRR